MDKQSEQTKFEYYTRFNASVDIVRLFLFSALPFRGHDENELSRRKGVFKTFLQFHGEKNDNVGKVIVKNAPGNHIMTSPDIQKEITNACSKETLKSILEELDNGYFFLY